MVRVFGLSGLRNAYRSVLSAVGSSEMSGASRWLEALLELGARRAPNSASSVAPAAARRMNAYLRIRATPFSDGRSVDVSFRWPSYAAHSHRPRDRFEAARRERALPRAAGQALAEPRRHRVCLDLAAR